MQPTTTNSARTPNPDAPPPKITCKLCRKKVYRRKDNQLFCSDACRKEFHAYGKISPERIKQKLLPSLRREFREELRGMVAAEVAKALQQKTEAA